jgi:hexosaminidase
MLGLLLCSAFSMIPAIIPYPNDLTVRSGQFELTSDAQIGYDASVPSADNLAQFAAKQLAAATGFALPVTAGVPAKGVYFGNAATASGEYYLNFSATVCQIYGASRTSLFYGLQSLLQLLPPEILLTSVIQIPWTAQNVSIHDSPRMVWRGAHVDCSRHFVDVPALKSYIDSISHYKMNVFHFHLVDDQGWRFESKKFPELTQVGSTRDSSPYRWHKQDQDGIPYGPYFYTQEEMRDIVSYAAEREITVVPEIEMPGHCLAALAAFPQYTCEGGPFRPLTIWGGDDHVYCPGNDDAIHFLEELLDEVMTIFPSNIVHVGGDEVSHVLWETCPKCQARMKEYNLKTTDELQSWFIAHFAQYLTSKGKRCIGWDEILQGGLPDDTMVMSWTGTAGGIKAAQLGHEVVMTPQQSVYLDRKQFTGIDPWENFGGFCPLHAVYAYNPTDGVQDQYKKYIVGVQGNIWTEYVWTQENFEWKVFPRVSAIAEVGWTQTDNLDWPSYLSRLTNAEYKRLAIRGIKPAPIAAGPPAQWERNEVPTKMTNLRWSVTGCIGAEGAYQIAFIYTGGKDPLTVSDVRLFINGVQAGADAHEGVAYETSSDNIWNIRTSISAENKRSYTSTIANVVYYGRGDSSGKIYVYG